MSLIYILRDGVVVDVVSKAAFSSGKPDASLRCPLLNHNGSKANAPQNSIGGCHPFPYIFR